MPSLRELKQRLQSVKTTQQIAGAMKTAATAKYSKASAQLEKNEPYAKALKEITSELGGFTEEELAAIAAEGISSDEIVGAMEGETLQGGRLAAAFSLAFGGKSGGKGKNKNARASTSAPKTVKGRKGKKLKRLLKLRRETESTQALRPLYVLISGNRGLCGGYNHELFTFFADLIKSRSAEAGECLTLACGRMAIEHCSEKSVPVCAEFALSDVPTYAEAERLCRLLTGLYSGRGVSEVLIVHQRFINMLKHEPAVTRLFPPEHGDDASKEDSARRTYPDDVLYVPDVDTVRRSLLQLYLTQQVYTLLLQCACGAQAATLMAMRSAYDNAEATALALETTINRRRQAEVTQSVLETASDFDRQY